MGTEWERERERKRWIIGNNEAFHGGMCKVQDHINTLLSADVIIQCVQNVMGMMRKVHWGRVRWPPLRKCRFGFSRNLLRQLVRMLQAPAHQNQRQKDRAYCIWKTVWAIVYIPEKKEIQTLLSGKLCLESPGISAPRPPPELTGDRSPAELLGVTEGSAGWGPSSSRFKVVLKLCSLSSDLAWLKAKNPQAFLLFSRFLVEMKATALDFSYSENIVSLCMDSWEGYPNMPPHFGILLCWRQLRNSNN